MPPRAQIDRVLRRAVDAVKVPGVVATAATDQGLLWIDPSKRVSGAIMTQILPVADPRALTLCGQFERGVYDAMNGA